jgi:hypothetical protein
MKTLKIAVLVLAALLLPALSLAQTGTALSYTTTSAIVNQGSTSFKVASLTGITGFGAINNAVGGTTSGNANTTDIYIDRELMQVVSVNTTALTVQVLRGQGGSQASAHASGAMVLAGPPAAFLNFDPEGYCGGATGTGVGPTNPPQYTPTINQRTGMQFLCSSVTKTWVPGFGNPGSSGTVISLTTLVADAAGTVTPSGPLFRLGGTTTAITGFVIPVGCNATAVGGCQFTAIPTTAWTWTAAGNIATTGTAVAQKPITFIWNASTSKFDVVQGS